MKTAWLAAAGGFALGIIVTMTYSFKYDPVGRWLKHNVPIETQARIVGRLREGEAPRFLTADHEFRCHLATDDILVAAKNGRDFYAPDALDADPFEVDAFCRGARWQHFLSDTSCHTQIDTRVRELEASWMAALDEGMASAAALGRGAAEAECRTLVHQAVASTRPSQPSDYDRRVDRVNREWEIDRQREHERVLATIDHNARVLSARENAKQPVVVVPGYQRSRRFKTW